MEPHVSDMREGATVAQFGKKLKELILNGTITPDTDPDVAREKVKTALSASGLELKPGVNLHVHQNDADNYHITLPHKEQLEKTEQTIANGDYVLPDKFDFACAAQNPASALDFYDFRLGDYVLQHCQ